MACFAWEGWEEKLKERWVSVRLKKLEAVREWKGWSMIREVSRKLTEVEANWWEV